MKIKLTESIPSIVESEYIVNRTALVPTWVFGTPNCAICKFLIEDEESLVFGVYNGNQRFIAHTDCFYKTTTCETK